MEKHRKKQFQWVLSLPAPAGSSLDHLLDGSSDPDPHHIPGEGERRYFGCNLLTWTKSAGKENQLPGDPEDKYLLLATPIDLKPDHSTTANLEFTTHQFRILQLDTQNLEMAASQVMSTPLSATGNAYRPSPLSATSAQWSTVAEASEDSDNTLTIDPRHEAKKPLSTIEDSFEELDQLEENIEAIAAAATQMTLDDRQDKATYIRGEQESASPSTVAKTAPPASQPVQRTPARPGKDETSRRSSTRNSTLMSDFDKDVEQAQPAATLRKVARPASLAPPKPIQRNNKPPTIPTFELPGERVARELKEKKAARLSLQANSPKAAAVSSPQRTRSVRSTKPPTVPNFELPGERYSRQKKERLEQRLKDEEEEIRRRRQFKARPPPSAGAPTVRSTFTSRQRQTTTGQSEQGNSFSPAAESSPKAGASKRQSVTMIPSSVRTASIKSASTVSTTARGRTSSIGSSQVSTRATSSSAGSVASGSKRNTMSTEEIQQQKTRGRHVYTRDNNVARSKEQEKRDREEAIKLARQKYAQMSRDLAAQSRARKG